MAGAWQQLYPASLVYMMGLLPSGLLFGERPYKLHQLQPSYCVW